MGWTGSILPCCEVLGYKTGEKKRWSKKTRHNSWHHCRVTKAKGLHSNVLCDLREAISTTTSNILSQLPSCLSGSCSLSISYKENHLIQKRVRHLTRNHNSDSQSNIILHSAEVPIDLTHDDTVMHCVWCACVWAVPLWVIHGHPVSKLNPTKQVHAATHHLSEWSGWKGQYFNQQQRRGQRYISERAELSLMSLTVN